MDTMQPIIHDGRVVDVVIAGQAIISEPLCKRDEDVVMAMCLYAVEVAAGQLPGPYTDSAALAHACAAIAPRNERP